MFNETTEMRDARHELQTLSASDPLARANILRHVAATTQLLTGRPSVEALPGEPLVGAGFRLVHGEERLFASLTRGDGVERVYLAFDIDDPQGPPIGLGLFRKEDGKVACYGRCSLWSPADDGRALLVPTGEEGPRGHFSFRRGRPLRWTESAVPGDVEAGVRRARARLARLLRSVEADALRQEGGTISSRPLPMAA